MRLLRLLQRLRYPTNRSRVYAWTRGIEIPDEGGKIAHEIEAYLRPASRLIIQGQPDLTPESVRREQMTRTREDVYQCLDPSCDLKSPFVRDTLQLIVDTDYGREKEKQIQQIRLEMLTFWELQGGKYQRRVARAARRYARREARKRLYDTAQAAQQLSYQVEGWLEFEKKQTRRLRISKAVALIIPDIGKKRKDDE